MLLTTTMMPLLVLATASLLPLSLDKELDIQSASDWGGGKNQYAASKAIDVVVSWSSRWAANLDGDAVSLVMDLGSAQEVKQVAIWWGHGEDYRHRFEIRTRKSEDDDWVRIHSTRSSCELEVF